MFNSDSDRDWEKFGRHDPYFGVITDERFRAANLSDANRIMFFASGQEYIDSLVERVRRHVVADFTIRNALDFGCGVGRLLIPLARISGQVTGVDVSDAMLAEARKNCEARAIGNVVLARSDDRLSAITGNYDFIHSFIVFQHIPPHRGLVIFQNLLARLADGGVGVVHFTYGKENQRKWLALLKDYVPLAKNLINLVRGRPFFAPQMQMNCYDLNRVFLLIQKAGAACCHTEFTDHGGELGMIVYFRKGHGR